MFDIGESKGRKLSVVTTAQTGSVSAIEFGKNIDTERRGNIEIYFT